MATLDGTANAVVQARVQGYLEKQFYQNGTVVKVGDPLFLIDPRPFQASLEQAKANLLNAEAKAVETDLTEKRQVTLFASRSVSEAERDQAVQMNSAAKANVKAVQAAVLNAQLNVDYTTVTAPIVGVAGIAKPGIGDLVGPTYGELCSISTVDPIKAVFQISEQEYMRAAAQNVLESPGGQSPPEGVKWQLVLADGKIVDGGKVTTINRQFDARTGTVQAEAVFPNPNNVLRPGFFARLRVVIPPVAGSLVVPQRAITEVQGTYMVSVVGEGNKVSVRKVQVGDRIGSDWVIKGGLKAGDKVVVEGLQAARDGAVVNPKPFAAKPEAGGESDAPTTAAAAGGK